LREIEILRGKRERRRCKAVSEEGCRKRKRREKEIN